MPVVVSFEGGIGVGKSTIISKLKETLSGAPGVVFVDEPVDEWMDRGLLQAMYDGTLNTATFQHMVLMSLAADLGRVILYERPALIITERSPVSNYYVFAKENLTGVDLESYKFVWDRFMGVSPPGIESHYVYLDADAATLAARMKERDRASEDSVSIAYMQALEKRHKAWLGEEANAHSVNADDSGDVVFGRVKVMLKELLSECGRAAEMGAAIAALT
mgnify:CR=1 FL=1|tara:strand:+ start:712 stop:1368 length:657 start_codon:yes stop_codon:yes gene_type:complete